MEIDFDKYNKVYEKTYFKKLGKVVNVVGLTIESNGPEAKLDDLCRIIIDAENDKYVSAEVIGFKDGKTLLMPFEPGIETAGKNELELPAKKIGELAPFILAGMVYGWKFEYVPYDKARGVQEFFEFTPIQEFNEEEIKSIKYTKPWIEDSVLNCWVEYRRTDNQIHSYRGWQSVLHPKIKGEGYAKISEGFDARTTASS